MGITKIKNEKQKIERLGEKRYNYQGCLMKIVKYNKSIDIIVEFQDEYKAKVHASYQYFLLGNVKNPYYPSVCGVGIIGDKYPISINGNLTKEYKIWLSMISRCFKKEYKDKYPTYIDVICCKEWLLYENFYEWVHNQENFSKWLNNNSRWCLDKDILIKGNKIYSSETCCLVPENVNNLFIKGNANRNNLPIGVSVCGNKYRANYHNPYTNKTKYLGVYSTPKEAFDVYKRNKENVIKQIAKSEYDKGNITEKCYNAMMLYQIEIND